MTVLVELGTIVVGDYDEPLGFFVGLLSAEQDEVGALASNPVGGVDQ